MSTSLTRLTLAALLALSLPALADEPDSPAEKEKEKEKEKESGKEKGEKEQEKAREDEDRGKRGDDPREKAPSRKKALEEYLKGLEAQRETMRLGELEVTVTAVPDYFVYQMIKELLTSEDLNDRPLDALKEQVARMAERRKGTMGKPAALVRFSGGGDRSDFYGFTGQLDDVLRVRVDAKSQRVTVAASQGDLPAPRQYTLFKASRSGAFGGGNVSPTWRTTIQVLPRKPFSLDLLLAKGPKEKAKTLDVALANLIRFSGSAITDSQMDFEKGASAEFERPAKVEFPLPLRGPAMPPQVQELMPEWQGD